MAWTGTSEEAWRDVDGNAILDAEGNEILITCETEKSLHEGDKWKNTANNEEYIYKSGNWIKICLPDSIMKQLDGKIDSYFYDYEPTTSNYPASEWKTDEEKESHNGDLFFWKQKGGGLCYRYVQINGEWTWYNVKDPSVRKALEDASKAQDTADGKRRNFITTPVPPYDTGDLWSQGSDGDLMRCQTARASGNYNSSDWIKAVKYTDDTAVDNLNKLLTQEEIFNRLTNNGEIQGIYSQDGQLYINFSYGKGGTLKLGGVNNENGTLIVLDAKGNEVGKWSGSGLNLKQGTISGTAIFLDSNWNDYIVGRTGELGSDEKHEVMKISNTGLHIDTTEVDFLPGDMVFDIDASMFSGVYIRPKKSGAGINSMLCSWGLAAIKNNDLSKVYNPISGLMSNNSATYKSDGINITGDNWMNNYTKIDATSIETTGTKNRIVETENYAQRLQYCYEMPSPLFGDVGEACTDDSGSCYVMLDDVFRETIADDSTYHVFITKEGQGDLWVAEKTPSYFIVQGTKNLAFSWEVKAKQKGYEMERLEICDPTATKEEAIDYEEEGFKVYTDYVEQIEVTNNIGEEN